MANEEKLEIPEEQIIVLEDDLGNEQQFEFLDVIEYEDEEYIVLLPIDENGEEGDEVVILKIESVDDENENYVGIDDEELIVKIFDIFKSRYSDEFDFE